MSQSQFLELPAADRYAKEATLLFGDVRLPKVEIHGLLRLVKCQNVFKEIMTTVQNCLDHLSMANMQISIRLGRESGDIFPTSCCKVCLYMFFGVFRIIVFFGYTLTHRFCLQHKRKK